MLQSLSAPLQSGLRFFQHPLPAIPSAFLADAPASTRRRDVGFAMFDCDDTDDLAPTYYTGSLVVRVPQSTRWGNRLLAFWLRACQRLWLAATYDACGSSLVLGISSSLVSPTALTLAVAATASRQSPHLDDGERLSRQLPSRPLPVAPVPIGYCGRNRSSLSAPARLATVGSGAAETTSPHRQDEEDCREVVAATASVNAVGETRLDEMPNPSELPEAS